jgi:hypothetical protein
MSNQNSNIYFSLDLKDDSGGIVDGWNLELYTEEEVLDLIDDLRAVILKYEKPIKKDPWERVINPEDSRLEDR